MREIKFRAWIFDGFDEGTKPFMAEREGIRYDPYILNQAPIVIAEDGNEWLLGKECYLLQYTGLKDRSNREIYEGDILEFEYNKDTKTTSKYREAVEWSVMKNWSGYDFCVEVNREIIGNIYENPELLEDK